TELLWGLQIAMAQNEALRHEGRQPMSVGNRWNASIGTKLKPLLPCKMMLCSDAAPLVYDGSQKIG
ncbi:hypothetical protein A2U01_0091807, partial [Trifolium medium]|nr:hypothetical protein [Trifolium medium]